MGSCKSAVCKDQHDTKDAEISLCADAQPWTFRVELVGQVLARRGWDRGIYLRGRFDGSHLARGRAAG